MPNYHGYESTITHFGAQWSPEYFDADGKSNVANDPAFKDAYQWQLDLVNKLGGYDKLEKYRSTFGDEFGAKNPFMTGQVAMAIDGEWRAGMIEADAPDVNFGVAPFPVPDDQADEYGKGYITGTIVGIASTSEKQNAAWRFVQFLTTDTQAVVDFANAIHNVPSTQAALASPDVDQDPNFQSFIDIASNPNSNTTPASPNGGAYQLTLQDLGYDIESGKQTDIEGGLQDAAHQIDTELEQAQ
jgi:multiple sugar transport system substrate-binding protein